MGPAQGGRPSANAREPHAYSDGLDLGQGPLEHADTRNRASLRVDDFEGLRTDDDTLVAYDLEARYGQTYDRAVLEAEGENDHGDSAEARTELAWGHAFAAFWDMQLGVRHDGGEGPSREWLAVGVEGLAPYWFEIEATAYIGEFGNSALRLDASYELLLTQKLILEPRIEANAYGQEDVERGLGSGLSDASVALRVRYEIRRQLAPYFGIEWVRKFGQTEDFARAAGDDPNDTRLVAGLRFWF
ncbi:MAG TPA: copper resistance protein B [Gammaproteobacteria bacterium]